MNWFEMQSKRIGCIFLVILTIISIKIINIMLLNTLPINWLEKLYIFLFELTNHKNHTKNQKEGNGKSTNSVVDDVDNLFSWLSSNW